CGHRLWHGALGGPLSVIPRHVKNLTTLALPWRRPSVKILTIRRAAHSECRMGTLSLKELTMPEPSELSRRERQIMDAVFALGEATVNQVVEAIPSPPTAMAVRRMRSEEHTSEL